eukprot:scaffold68764_cov56-Attheya_sp.AAC.3
MARGGIITSSRQEETKRRCCGGIVPFGSSSIAVWVTVCFVVGILQRQEEQSTIIISFVSAFRSSGSQCLLSAAATSSTRHRSVACLQGGRTGIALLGLHIHHPLGTSFQMESDNDGESARRSTRRTKPTAANENERKYHNQGSFQKRTDRKEYQKEKATRSGKTLHQ